jgi:hypothetical protein
MQAGHLRQHSSNGLSNHAVVIENNNTHNHHSS